MDTAIPCLPSSANCTTGTSYYYYPDWPRIGTWSNGFYISFDLQDPTVGYTEAGFEACQLDRADMVLGQSANPMTCYTYMIPQNEEPSLIHSVDVGDIDSATGPPNGEPEYFLSVVSPSNEQQGNNGQGVCTSQSTPCTSNQLALFYLGNEWFGGTNLRRGEPIHPGLLRHLKNRQRDQHGMRSGAEHESFSNRSVWQSSVWRLCTWISVSRLPG